MQLFHSVRLTITEWLHPSNQPDNKLFPQIWSEKYRVWFHLRFLILACCLNDREPKMRHICGFSSSFVKLEFMVGVENVWKIDTERRFFRNICHLKGFSDDYTFSLYKTDKIGMKTLLIQKTLWTEELSYNLFWTLGCPCGNYTKCLMITLLQIVIEF